MGNQRKCLRLALLPAFLVLSMGALAMGQGTAMIETMPSSDAVDWPPPKSTVCPSWLDEYARWHRANRGSANATYLVQYCPRGIVCLGIGDRMKGIMVLLRLAAIHKKVLLMVWDHPEPIKDYLHPNFIDWTLEGLPKDVVSRINGSTESTPFDIHLTENMTAMKELLETGKHADAFQAHEVIRVQSNLWFGMPIHGSDDDVFLNKYGRIQFGRCLFRFMFKLAPQLQSEALDKLRSVYGRDPRPYTAWHWRQGGMVSEGVLHRSDHHPGKKELEYSKLRTLMSVLPCAEKITQKAGGAPLHERPLLLVTDHNLVRVFVAERELRSVVAFPATVVHMGSKFMNSQAYRDSWLDLVMLSMSECFVYSKSGYSNVALWMSDTMCTIPHFTCVTHDEPRFEHYPV